MVLELLFSLCLLLPSTSSLLIDVPDLVSNYCNTNLDCGNYIHSRCDNHECKECNTGADCDHLYSPGQCSSSNRCIIPCNPTSNYEICMNRRLICDTYYSPDRCWQCSSNSDCSGFPSGTKCVYSDDEPNFCGGCSDTDDCDSGHQCKNFKCWQCDDNPDCPTSKPFCLKSFNLNTCKPCTNNDNNYCTAWQTSKCVGNDCVGCQGPSDCTHINGRPTCFNNKCVTCTSSTQCTTEEASYCNPATGVCEHCSGTGDCAKFPVKKVCGGSVGCIECIDSSTCTTPLKSSCDTTNKLCQVCQGAGDCTPKFPLAPICTAGGCVGCLVPTDCQDVTKSFCDTTDNSCKPCQSSSDCSHLSLTPVCTYPTSSTKKCVQCLTSVDDCKTPAKSFCNTATNLCQTCNTDPDCSHLTSTKLCSPANGRCVECKSYADCPDITKSNCESTTKTCQKCSSNDHCSQYLLTPVCIPSGCAECGANTDCMSPTSSYCSPTLNECEACSTDKQCKHIPSMNKCWSGECVFYSDKCLPEFNIKITQGIPPSIFYIKFPAELVTQINIAQELQLKLENIDSIYYQYNLTSTSATDYQVRFKFKKTIPKTKLWIELPCPSQPGKRFGNITQSLKTLKIPYSPGDLTSTMETIGAIAQTTSTSVTIISGAMMFIGANPAILWALIGLLQTFYYMLFINVQYPANVEAFFPVFTLGNLDFIPNPMWIIFPNIDEFSLAVPQKFADYEVDGLFLANAGNMLLLWILNLAVYGASYLFIRYTRNMPGSIIKLCRNTVSVFEWSGAVRTFTTSFMEISVASFLQLRILTFSSGLFAASSVCGVIFGLFSALLPVVAFKIVQMYDTKPTYISLKFSTLIEEYRLNDDIHKYFTVIALGKNLIFASSLVFLHNYPYTEIITIISISFSYSYLIWKYKPYESKVGNYANLVSEGVFGVVYVLIFILIHDDYSPSFSDDERLNVGWGIILGCGIVLMSSVVIAIAEQYSVIKNGIVMLKNVWRKRTKTREERMKKLRTKINRTNQTSDHLNRDPSFADQTELLDGDLADLSRNQQLKLTRLKRAKREFNRNLNS